MSNYQIRTLRAQGHHLEADQLERREILLEFRAKGSHELADAIERGTPIGADGRMNLEAMQAQRDRELEDFATRAEVQANGGYTGRPGRSVLDDLTNNHPADSDPRPDEGRY